jgi:hypothetical protein
MSAVLASPLRVLRDPDLPSRHSRELMSFGQDDALFFQASARQTRQRRLREHFAAQPVQRILIGNNLRGFDYRHASVPVGFLDKGCFEFADAAALEQMVEAVRDAVVIVNNNDVGHGNAMPGFTELLRRCERTVFIGWDWDNHHWLEVSCFLAAHSDVYAPAHHENLYLLSRYNATLAGPVYCAAVQWPRAFLTEQLPAMLTAERSDAPLGKHIPYAPFGFRNRVVTTLSQRYPSIGFSDRSFHVRTPEERLAEWTAHKLHWIVPVLNDVPIRIFDALITGGIPVLPESLRHLPPVRDLPREHVVFYGPQDIVEPQAVVEQGVALFNRGGREGMVARHRLALDRHHGDPCIAQMLAAATEQFGLRF